MSYFVFIQSWGIFQKPGDKLSFLVFFFFIISVTGNALTLHNQFQALNVASV